MRNVNRRAVARLLAVAMLSVQAACGNRDKEPVGKEPSGHDDGVSFVKRDTSRKLGPGDIRITNDDSTFELALVGDSIVTGLGKKVLAKVTEKTDTMAIKGNGLAATIEKAVKGAVNDAMNHEIQYPIADIQDVRVEDGRLRFYKTDGSRMKLFESTKTNGREVAESFRPEDAQRFIAAFHARKGAAAR